MALKEIEMKITFSFIFVFISIFSVSGQENRQNHQKLTYTVKVLCMAEIISNANITDSAKIYCLLNDDASRLKLKPLESSAIFKKHNYVFYNVTWDKTISASCIGGVDSFDAHVFTSNYSNALSSFAHFKIAIKTEKVPQKDGSVRRLHSIFKIKGFDINEVEKVLSDVYSNRAKKMDEIKKAIEKDNIFVETIDLLEMVE